jgi:hypothetical protein
MNAQTTLVSDIENTADWREFKAAEYPEDARRNQSAAKALRTLLNHVEHMDEDDELFQLQYLLLDYEDDSLTERFCGDRNLALRQYGFQDKSTPEEWVENQIRSMKMLMKNPV